VSSPTAPGAAASAGRTDHGAVPRFARGLHEVAEGVHAWLTPNGDWGESNAGVVAGPGGALVVDTLWDPPRTREFLEAARRAVGVPFMTLVNTHADGDHTWGNGCLAGGVEIVSSARAAHLMAEEPPAALQRFQRLAPVLRRVGSLPVPVLGSLGGLPRIGRVPLRELGGYIDGMLSPYDWRDVDVVLPTRTFEGSLTLDAGGREVVLHEVAPAHTAGDIVVHVPDAAVVFAGDVLFVGVHPVMWAGPTASWVAALDRITALQPRVVVPGHGPVASLAEVGILRSYLAWVDAAASARLASGGRVPDVARALLREDLDAGAPWEHWDSPERILITVAAIDRHRRGVGGRSLTPRDRTTIFAQVATLARELRREARRA
jgi:cyclase